MKLSKMIIDALQISNMTNGALSLEHQNQEREFEKIPDIENKGEISLLPDESHPHKVRHSQHNNKINVHQTSRSLDELQGDDPRHPYSAHEPKKRNSSLDNNRTQRERVVEQNSCGRFSIAVKLKYRYFEKDTEFGEIVKRMIKENPTEINLLESLYKQSSELCEAVHLEREGIKSVIDEKQQELKLLKKSVKREEYDEEYYYKCSGDLIDLKEVKRNLNNLLDNCRKLKNLLNDSVKSRRSTERPKTPKRPTTTERPTLSLQEESMTTRFRDISDSVNDLIQNINLSHERISELQSHLNKNLSHDAIKSTKQSIDCFEKIILPRFESKLTDLKSIIINEKNYLEISGKEGTISPSLVTKFTNEYSNLIDQIEQPIHYSNNSRNKRDLSAEPSLSEKLANISTNKWEQIPVTKREPTIAR